jgi:branched-chain amino acid transport system substrate-binding protein
MAAMTRARRTIPGIALLGLAWLASPAAAQKHYDTGASDTEIKLGETSPFSGPNSAIGTIGRANTAYFKMVNDQGGINGRKVNFISLDDGFDPARAVEQTRKLVEEEQVLAIVGGATLPSAAVQRYLNAKKMPQLFIMSGAKRLIDPERAPWTVGWQPNYYGEARIYAKYILQNIKDAKIAVLYENDDFGKDFLNGFKSALGDQSKLIVAEASYESTDATADSQIVSLQGSGANVFFSAVSIKFGALAIRKVYDIGWKPIYFTSNVATSLAATLVPAGVEKAVGLISTRFLKDPSDPAWASDKGVQDYLAFLKSYAPGIDPKDVTGVFGYSQAQTLRQVLTQCGDDLTRENVLKQALSLSDFELPLLIPGIKLNTGPTRYGPIDQLQMIRFDGKVWVGMGEVMSGS